MAISYTPCSSRCAARAQASRQGGSTPTPSAMSTRARCCCEAPAAISPRSQRPFPRECNRSIGPLDSKDREGGEGGEMAPAPRWRWSDRLERSWFVQSAKSAESFGSCPRAWRTSQGHAQSCPNWCDLVMNALLETGALLKPRRGRTYDVCPNWACLCWAKHGDGDTT